MNEMIDLQKKNISGLKVPGDHVLTRGTATYGQVAVFFESEAYENRIAVIAVDEVHLLQSW